ncbi:ion channel [Pseudophaeobacter sp.]|uniref:ion channel n=1 Tax=Pseudophaeobacter sp. TaxID=1971739 RepID=UPI0032992719
MTMLQQLFWGSGFLCLCLVIETVVLVFCADALRRYAKRFGLLTTPMRRGGFLLIAIGYILFCHTLQVWIWAASFVWMGAIGDWNTAAYFSIVTYTTLGYGDIVLGNASRIFGAFVSINGLLGFGISTAFLVGSMSDFFKSSKDVEQRR